MTISWRHRTLRLFESALWLIVLVCAGILTLYLLRAHGAATRAQQLAARSTQSSGTHTPHTAPAGESSPSSDDAVVGRLDIPSLQLSVPVLENYDPATLVQGAGRIPGTAQPGGLGNLVLVGHRDTFFRPLRAAVPGMQIRIVTGDGAFRYQIDSTEVVNPDRVSVLNDGDRPGMTLITCYPFEYVGAAPQRFIVHAHLLSLEPEKS